jgi:ankyrin repeat protein
MSLSALVVQAAVPAAARLNPLRSLVKTTQNISTNYEHSTASHPQEASSILIFSTMMVGSDDLAGIMAAAPSVPQAIASTGRDWEAGEQERKKQKEKFFLFTEILTESLEKEDPALHAKVKATMDDCKKRSEQGELGYEYVTTSMRIRLKEAVNHGHWERAETDLEKALVQKEEERRQKEEERRQKQAGIRYGRDSGFCGRGRFFGGRRTAEKDFSLFCRVLVKYLEQQDPTLQAKVEATIKECVKQNRQEGKRAFNTDINGTKSRLREMVSDDHWKGAEIWADNFEKVLADFREKVGGIARSADNATSFLQSLPVDPMSQVLVDTALSEVLCKDPLLQVVKLFVQKSSETPNTPRDYLLLHRACSGGASFDVLQYLIEIYPQGVNTVNDSGELPLHIFLHMHKEMREKTGRLDSALASVALLVDAAPASLSVATPDGRLPLHVVFDLLGDHMTYSPWTFQVASLLMERYPQALNTRNMAFCRYLPLQHAIWRSAPLAFLQRILELAPDSSKHVRSLHMACEHGRLDVARMLLTRNGLQDKKRGNWYPLNWRARNFGDRGERVPERLLKSFINDCQNMLGPADFMDWLHVQVRAVVERGNVADTASLLRQSPPDAVSWALTHRDETDRLIIELELAKCEAAVNTEKLSLLIAHAPGCLEESTGALGQTPLHSAVSHDNKWAVKIILTGYDKAVWQRDIYGRLPLHVAVMAGASLDVLMLLIDSYPAALWTRDNKGYVPLHHAFHVGPERVGWWTPSCNCKKSRLRHAGITRSLGVVGLLVRHHEDAHQSLWIEDNNGRLPLHHAVVEDGRLVDFLIQMGPVACKSVDSGSRLPLHMALESQASKETVEVLLDNHDLAQLEQRDEQGRLPFQVACESDCSLAVMYLLVRGAPHLVHDVFPARSWT